MGASTLRAALTLALFFSGQVFGFVLCKSEVLGRGRPKIYEASISTNENFLKQLKFGMFNLSKLTLPTLFEYDAEWAEQIRMKGRILNHRPDKTFVVGEQKETSQKAGMALLRLVVETLVTHPSETARGLYQWDGRNLACPTAQKSWDLENLQEHPLRVLGQIIPDDILITSFGRPDEQSLLAGFVAFPSNWVLSSDIDWNIDRMHDYARETGGIHYADQLANIGKMVAQMEINSPILRNNWFIYDDPTLSQPGDRRGTSYEVPEITQRNIGEDLYVRSEREAFLVFEADGHKYFAMFIRPFVYPLKELVRFAHLRMKFLAGLLSDRDKYRAGEYWAPVTRYVQANPPGATAEPPP